MHILIIRFSSFGDIILTTPVINELINKYPDAEIDYLVYKNFSDAITFNPKIKRYYYFDKKMNRNRKYIFDMIEHLKTGNYDYVIDLHSKFLSQYIGKKISKKCNAIYLKYSKRKWWKSVLVKMRIIRYKVDRSIVKSYFTAVKKLRINYVNEEIDFYFSNETETQMVEKYGLKNRKYIVLAPGASKVTKEWIYYEELANKLAAETDYDVVVIGGKEDYLKVKEIQRIQNLAGKLNFKESGVILKYAKFAVTNDSGPFHIARAMKTKTIVIFGPTDPKMFTYNERTYLLTSRQDCSPCSLHGDKKCPKGHFKCMKELTHEKVYDKIIDKIDN